MQNTVELFKQNGYVHLKDFLDDDNCRDLTGILRDLVAQGKTTKTLNVLSLMLFMAPLLLINF
jgi:hypothetical protein